VIEMFEVESERLHSLNGPALDYRNW